MRTLVLAVALVLALAPAAAAKEIKQAEVCGADGCSSVDDHGSFAILENGGPPRTPPTAAPYYDVRITMREGDSDTTWSFAAVPSRHAMRVDDGTWLEMPPEEVALIKHTATGHKPYPAGDLLGTAPDPTPQPSSAGGSPLWPEGVIIVAVALGAALAVRRAWLRAAAKRA